MLDVAFAGLKLLRDVYRTVRDAKSDVDKCYKSLDRMESLIYYMETTVGRMSTMPTSGAGAETRVLLRPILRQVQDVRLEAEPFIHKQHMILKPINTIIQKLSFKQMSAHKLVFCMKVNTQAACKLISTALMKKAATAAKSAGAEVPAEGEAGAEEAAMEHLSPELKAVYEIVTIIQQAAKAVSVGDGLKGHADSNDDDSDEKEEAAELAALTQKYGAQIEALMSADAVQNVLGNVLTEFGALDRVIDAQLLKDLLGKEHAEDARRLHAALKGDDEKLTVAKAAEYVVAKAPGNSAFFLLVLAAKAQEALHAAGSAADGDDGSLTAAFAERLAEVADTVLLPLLRVMTEAGFLIESLMLQQEPMPEDDLMEWLDKTASAVSADLANNVKLRVAPLSVAAGISGLQPAAIGEMMPNLMGTLRTMMTGVNLKVLVTKINEERELVDSVARELSMVTTSLAAMSHLGTAADYDPDMMVKLSPTQRTTAAARAIYGLEAAAPQRGPFARVASRGRVGWSDDVSPTGNKGLFPSMSGPRRSKSLGAAEIGRAGEALLTPGTQRRPSMMRNRSRSVKESRD